MPREDFYAEQAVGLTVVLCGGDVRGAMVRFAERHNVKGMAPQDESCLWKGASRPSDIEGRYNAANTYVLFLEGSWRGLGQKKKLGKLFEQLLCGSKSHRKRR